MARPTFDYRHQVTLEETNLLGNVYFAHYLRWQGQCRERFLAERAPGVFAALGPELTLVTVSCGCDYYAELLVLDIVELRMSLLGSPANQVHMSFDYYRLGAGTAELVARGRQVVACARRDGRSMRPVDIPAELQNALIPYSVDAARVDAVTADIAMPPAVFQ